MRPLRGRVLVSFVLTAAALLPPASSARAQTFTKAVVGDHIKKVEDGVDEFRKYLEKRGEDAQGNAQAASQSGARRGRPSISRRARE